MINSLPKIVRFTGVSDYGPSEGQGSTECPHCGARGRYVHHFLLENGKSASAMSGCVKLFPVAPIAHEEARLSAKERDYKEKGWKGLNKLDTAAMHAIEEFYAGRMTEQKAMDAVKFAKSVNSRNYRR